MQGAKTLGDNMNHSDGYTLGRLTTTYMESAMLPSCAESVEYITLYSIDKFVLQGIYRYFLGALSLRFLYTI